MSVSIIFGGQYGSEGKGKVSYLWAKKNNSNIVVRVGGTNSGHTVYINDKKYIFRMLPTPCILPNVISILPAGSYIDIEILMNEILTSQLNPERLFIDPNAVIIKDEYKQYEHLIRLGDKIGSTSSGIGAAVSARNLRSSNILLAREVDELKPYIKNVKVFLRESLNKNENIIIEGTQGYGLSNYHSKYYPFATSRDTSAAGFLSETGLSPFDVEYIIMVIRSLPIRVGGNSGPLANEIDWEKVSKESGAEEKFFERTTVTKKIRRVGRFDPEIVKDAIVTNKPNIIVMNHLDYVDFKMREKLTLSDIQKNFIRNVEDKIGQKINYVGNDKKNWIQLN